MPPEILGGRGRCYEPAAEGSSQWAPPPNTALEGRGKRHGCAHTSSDRPVWRQTRVIRGPSRGERHGSQKNIRQGVSKEQWGSSLSGRYDSWRCREEGREIWSWRDFETLLKPWSPLFGRARACMHLTWRIRDPQSAARGWQRSMIGKGSSRWSTVLSIIDL